MCQYQSELVFHNALFKDLDNWLFEMWPSSLKILAQTICDNSPFQTESRVHHASGLGKEE